MGGLGGRSWFIGFLSRGGGYPLRLWWYCNISRRMEESLTATESGCTTIFDSWAMDILFVVVISRREGIIFGAMVMA